MQSKAMPGPESSLIAEWRHSAVIVGPDAFKSVDRQKEELAWISGDHSPRWMRGANGEELVVVKRDNAFYHWGRPHRTAVRERIAFELADQIGLPVAPARIWKNPSDRNAPFYAVSLKVQPGLTQSPPVGNLLSDDAVPAMTVFDIWIFNTDRKPNSIVFNPNFSPSDKVFVDHGLSNYREPKAVMVPLREFTSSALTSYVWTRIQHSAQVGSTIEAIKNIPDKAIQGIVHGLDDELFQNPGSAQDKQDIVDRLCYRRDNLPSLIADCFALI